MLSIIRDACLNMYGLDEESILTAIEKAGMLPPHYEYRGNLYDVQSRIETKCIWEPEDEEE